jgi:cytochrome c
MSFEANKIAGAILAAMILAMVAGIVSNILVHPTPLAKQAYEVAGGPPEGGGATAEAAAPAGPEPIAPLMANANADAGKAKTQLCAACHTFDKGGPNRIGPNLYGVIGSPIAEDRGGFAFSSALTTKGKGQTWTLDNLNAWLFKPQQFASGTKMTFIGLPKAEDRANVIAYLNSLSDKPLSVADLTKGAATGAPAGGEKGAAPAGGEKAGAAAPAGGQKAAAPAQAAAPGPGNTSSNAPTTNGPSQTNGAAPKTPGNEQGSNPSSSATEGQAK